MKKYKYKAKDKDNKIRKGVLFASSEEELREILNKEEYYLQSYIKMNDERKFKLQKKITTDDLSFFSNQLAIMISSGIDLCSVIKILKNSCKNDRLKEILDVINLDLNQGKMLSETMNKFPNDFPVFFLNMVRIGEVSGKLEQIFTSLSVYYEKMRKNKQKIKSTLSYPIALLVLGFTVLVFLVAKIVPIFVDVFASFNGDIPAITVAVLSVSNHFKTSYGYYLVVIFLVLVFYLIFRKTYKVRYMVDGFKTKFKLTKNVFKSFYSVIFSEGLNVMIMSGNPIIESIDTMKKLLGNIYLEKRIEGAVHKMKIGVSVATSLSNVNYFPDTLIEMITIGEKSGNLEDVLGIITKYYNDEYDFALKKLIGVIEPMLILFIGGIIAIILLSIFIPMLEIMNVVDKV